MRRLASVLLLALPLVSFGCSSKKSSSSGDCSVNADCPSGAVCMDGGCSQLCSVQSDCASGEVCSSAGICRAIANGDLPTIDVVEGNASVPSQILDGLVVTGSLLDGATFELRSQDSSVALAIRTQSATSAELVLPADVRSGAYTLVATNAAGSAQAVVTLTLPEITGDSIISRINDATTTAAIALTRLALPVQQRVTGTCSPGLAVTAVNEDGSVSCDSAVAGLDADGDGTVDASALPAGLFRHRIVNGRKIYGVTSGRPLERSLTFLKSDPGSVLEITSAQVGGGNMKAVQSTMYSNEIALDDGDVFYAAAHASATATGWRLFPHFERMYVPSIGAGVHTLVADSLMQNISEYLYAWNGTSLFEVREVPASENLDYVTFTSDIRNTSTAFIGVTDRGLTYTKQGSASVPVLVTLQDTWGSYDPTAGGGLGCRWQLFVDGSPYGGELDLHVENDSGWVIEPMMVGWVIDGLAPGPYYFELKVAMGGASNQCLNGWSSKGMISAIELDPTHSAFVKDQADAPTTATTWTPIPGRAVSYTKTGGAETELRVTWMDNTGFEQNAYAPACAYRLLMDGVEIGQVQEHAANLTGWRLRPTTTEFIVPSAAAGAHNFTLEYMRLVSGGTYGAKTCRAGWDTSGTNPSNFLLVREMPRND